MSHTGRRTVISKSKRVQRDSVKFNRHRETVRNGTIKKWSVFTEKHVLFLNGMHVLYMLIVALAHTLPSPI